MAHLLLWSHKFALKRARENHNLFTCQELVDFVLLVLFCKYVNAAWILTRNDPNLLHTAPLGGFRLFQGAGESKRTFGSFNPNGSERLNFRSRLAGASYYSLRIGTVKSAYSHRQK